MTPYAYFKIADFPHYLVTDTREWRRPYLSSRKWQLVVSNFSGPATIHWLTEALPDTGYFYLLTPDSCINLRETNHFDFSGNPQIEFVYHAFPLVGGWHLPFTVLFDEKSFEIELGGDVAATDGFDPDLDQIAPPPGMTDYACLQTDEFPYYWAADYRDWQLAGQRALAWHLRIQISEGDTAKVQWDSRWLPQFGEFRLSAPGINQNLRLAQTLTLVHSQVLQLDYVPPGALSKPKIKATGTDAPQAFDLAQNFPNPFNNETLFRYQVPVADQVELSIFNSLGQKIINLVAAKHSAGNYEIRWSGTDANGQPLPSGLYFYRLQTSRSVAVKKMLLMK